MTKSAVQDGMAIDWDVSVIRDAQKPLEGRVEMDDAFLGGERSGGKRGRGSPGKLPIVAAVEPRRTAGPCA